MHATHLRNTDLNLLVALWQLHESKSVTGAAEELGVSQPAMSRTLGRLRKTFGDELFVRTSAGLRATPRALALRPLLEQVLSGAETLVAGPETFAPKTARRTFTISTSDYSEAVLLPALLTRLAKEAPGLRLKVLGPVVDTEARLERGELDLAWTPKGASGRQVVWTKLFDETFAFVLRRGHPALARPWTMERWLSLRHVALAPQGRDDQNPLDAALSRKGLAREVAASVPNFLSVPALVSGSDLGATLPRRIIARSAARFGLVARELPFATPGFSFFQAWHERVRKDPGHAWLRQLVATVARELD